MISGGYHKILKSLYFHAYSYRYIHVPLPQTSLSLIFQSFSSRPLTNLARHYPLLESYIYLSPGGPRATLTVTKWMPMYTTQTSTHQSGFSYYPSLELTEALVSSGEWNWSRAHAATLWPLALFSPTCHLHFTTGYCWVYLTLCFLQVWQILDECWMYDHFLINACLNQGPVTPKELRFKWCIISHCMWHGLVEDSQGVCVVIPQLGHALFSHHWHSDIIGFVRSKGPLAPQAGPVTYIPFLFWASLKATRHWCKWAQIVFPGWNMLPPEFEEAHQRLCLRMIRGTVKCTTLFFTLKGICWHIPDHLIPKNITDMVGSWILTAPWRACILTRPSTCLQLLVYLVQVAQCYQYMGQYQCDFMSRGSRPLLTTLWWRAGKLPW